MTRAATVFLAIATCLVVGALVAGFMIIPTPSQQRAYTLDEKRVQALTTLSFAVYNYTSAHGELPPDLDMLSKESGQVHDHLNDPATGRPYEFIKGTDLDFQLCAVFEAPSLPGAYVDFRHSAGRQCMSKKVNAQRKR